MGRSREYIEGQVAEARKDAAPRTAIYKSATTGAWILAEDVIDEGNRAWLEKVDGALPKSRGYYERLRDHLGTVIDQNRKALAGYEQDLEKTLTILKGLDAAQAEQSEQSGQLNTSGTETGRKKVGA